jgi:transcriptional regulator with GAF, ATPase, and Fis domain
VQEGQLERLGSPRVVEIDVRIVAATNRDLGEEVRKGQFRRDLYYRLNVFPITVPALRERRNDIPALVQHLVARYGKALGKRIDTIPSNVIQALSEHEWPGNIRELENVIQRAIILSPGSTLALSEAWLPSIEPVPIGESVTLLEIERRHIAKVLQCSRGRIEGAGGAAQVLGLKPSTLRSRMAKLGIARVR